MSTTIRMLFPLPWCDGGIGHTAGSICRHVADDEITTELITPKVHSGPIPSFVRPILPRALRRLPYRLTRGIITRHLERAYSRMMDDGDVAWLFSDVSLNCSRSLRSVGVPVIREKFNCHKATAQRILDEAYARLGTAPAHGITQDDVLAESQGLALADIVSSPSPLVTKSLADAGVPPTKIMETSYGWEPDRVEGTRRAMEPIAGITVLSVGSVCVRKGAHLLLEAWSRAGVDGRLLLCGDVEPAIARCCAAHLNRPDVEVLGHVSDVGAVYRTADMLVLPTLEEGSPLIVYEAMGCGVPLIVSPMAAGSVVRDQHEGFVREPYELESYIDAIRQLATNADLRSHFANAARTRALDFTWQAVAARRRDELRARGLFEATALSSPFVGDTRAAA